MLSMIIQIVSWLALTLSVLKVCVLILYLLLYHITGFKKREAMESSGDGTQNNTPYESLHEPTSVFVEKSVLKRPRFKPKRSFNYVIDNEVFYEEETIDREDYVEFQVFAERRRKETKLSEDRDGNTEVISQQFTVKYTNDGVIVNQTIHLTKMQWHTAIEVASGCFQCIVCDSVFEDVEPHLASQMHLLKLDAHKPFLFNNCVLRAVELNWHCAFCNIVIKANDFKHFASDLHKHYTQKAVGGTCDLDVRAARKKAVIEPAADKARRIDSIWDGPSPSYSQVTKSNLVPSYLDVAIGSQRMRVQFEHWHMITDISATYFYCIACVKYVTRAMKAAHCSDSEHLSKLKSFKVLDYPNAVIRQVEVSTCHCACCNALYRITDINKHVTQMRLSAPKNPFQSAHKTNKEICPINANNLFKLAREPVNIHASTSHERAISSNKKPAEITNVIAPTVSDSSPANINVITEYLATVEPIAISGYRLFLPRSHVQVICVRSRDYYCGICNSLSTDDIVRHLNSPLHISLWSSIPFVEQFSYNGIRWIRGALHCAVCNTPVDPGLIREHLDDAHHKSLLYIATGYRNKTVSVDTTVIREEMLAIADEKSIFDYEAYLYVCLNKLYKISYYSYNCLVAFGDQTVLCMLCSVRVVLNDVQKHVNDPVHLEELRGTKYLAGCDGLFRLVKTWIHCSTCNVRIAPHQMDSHSRWQHHKTNIAINQPDRKTRRKDIKQGVKKIDADVVQMKKKYTKAPAYEAVAKIVISETKIVIDTDYCEGPTPTGPPPSKTLYSDSAAPAQPKDEAKRYQIVVLNKVPMRVPFRNWHGVASSKSGCRCILCHEAVQDIDTHITNKKHRAFVSKPMVNNNSRHLLRLMEYNLLHCVICNSEVSIQPHIVKNHIKGHKHERLFEALKAQSSGVNLRLLRDEDVVYL